MSENSGMFGASGSGDTSGFGGLARSAANFGSSERPYGSYFDEVTDELERAYPEFNSAIEKVVIDRGELTLHVKREKLFDTADKTAKSQTRAVNELHNSLEKNTRALQDVQCLKRFNG